MEVTLLKRDVAIISFKALSIYAFVQAIDNFAHEFRYLFITDVNVVFHLLLIQVLTPPLLLIIAGALLWFFASSLASSVCNRMELNDKPNIVVEDIQVIVFASIGLFLIANSFPNLVQGVIMHFGIVAYALDSKREVVFRNREIVGSLLKIGLGLWLLFGAHGIVNFVRSMRRD
jgi:hypothetical protein